MRSTITFSPDAARLLILIVTGVGLLLWLTALILWNFVRNQQPLRLERLLVGKSLSAARNSLSRAAALQEPMWDLVGGNESHAIFDVSIGSGIAQVHVDVSPHEQGCQLVASTSQTSMGTWQKTLTTIWLTVEPLVILTAAYLMWVHLAASPNTATRGQSLQIIQIVHVVWPPFLFWATRRNLTSLLSQRIQRYLTTVELL